VSRRTRGYSLPELLTVVAILGAIVTVTVPAFANMRRRTALRSASAQLRSVFHLTRSRAIAHNVNCATKFLLLAGQWHFAVYEDGDGDGVRNDDISKGKDPMVERPQVLFPESRLVIPGLLRETIKDPDGDPLPPTKSPISFNNSMLCSFSPRGEATPGTIYLTDHGRDLFAVRVYGATAKIRVLRYDRLKRKWGV
jgi:prepilin-type N-terminal cleavage/methylation domain-containing protein